MLCLGRLVLYNGAPELPQDAPGFYEGVRNSQDPALRGVGEEKMGFQCA